MKQFAAVSFDWPVADPEGGRVAYNHTHTFIPLVVSTPGARAPRLRLRRPLFF